MKVLSVLEHLGTLAVEPLLKRTFAEMEWSFSDPRAATDRLGREAFDLVLVHAEPDSPTLPHLVEAIRTAAPDVSFAVIAPDERGPPHLARPDAPANDVMWLSESDRSLREILARLVEATRLRREVAGLRRLVGHMPSGAEAAAPIVGSPIVTMLTDGESTDAIERPAPSLAARLGAVFATVTTLPSLREMREQVERAYLVDVLRRARGNVTHAARVAGRHRTDFYDLLRRHALSPAGFKGSGRGEGEAG